MLRNIFSTLVLVLVVFLTLVGVYAADVGPTTVTDQGGYLTSTAPLAYTWPALTTNQTVSGKTNRATGMQYCKTASVVVTAGAGTTNITCTIIDDGATVTSPTISLTTAGQVKKAVTAGPLSTLELDCDITDGTIADVTARCN